VRKGVPGDAVERIAGVLRRKEPVTLFLGGQALRVSGLRAAARIEAASGCRLMMEILPARLERGAGIPSPARMPYFPEQVLEALSGARTIVLAGAKEPVAFFGYPGLPSRLVPEGCEVAVLARVEDDVVGALGALADALGAAKSVELAEVKRPELPRGTLDVVSLGAALTALQPEGAIVVDESATSGGPYAAMAAAAAPHTSLFLTGGAIGQGLPVATGAAIACPGRRVIALQADGSAMYTLQALWTQAREGLDVTTLVCANRMYRILKIEAARAGIVEPGRNARALTELAPPEIGWVELARSLGVPGARVETADELVQQLGRALATAGPTLIEVVL
jgi:acetolactate synthase-1/2/3 large subunit